MIDPEEIFKRESNVVVGIIKKGKSRERICPVCNKTFTEAGLVSECSVSPRNIEDKHCFISAGPGKIGIFVHGQEDKEEELNEKEATEIEMQ